jgi:hypothetical protein
MQNGRVSAHDLQATKAATPAASGLRQALALIWEFWKAYAERIAFFQTNVILTIIYVIVAGPISAIGRLTGHHFLPMSPRNAPTFWQPAHMGRITGIDELKKQG